MTFPHPKGMEQLVLLHARIPHHQHDQTRFWMSRLTLLIFIRTVPLTLDARLRSPMGIDDVTLFGVKVMIDDRMPEGVVTAEQHYGGASITGHD